jgi:hypothetical protein
MSGASPSIGDLRSRELAQRLRRSATTVEEPQLSRIKRKYPETVFVSHSSADDALIKGAERFPQPGSIWWIVCDKFPDPFYHSLKTGGADSYERIVGLALLVSRRAAKDRLSVHYTRYR